jgi:hypothetical protein
MLAISAQRYVSVPLTNAGKHPSCSKKVIYQVGPSSTLQRLSLNSLNTSSASASINSTSSDGTNSKRKMSK